MNLTDKLKGWLVEHMGVAETASDKEFQTAATQALIEGKLSTEELYRMTTDMPTAEEVDIGKTVQDAVMSGVSPLAERLSAIEEKVAGIDERDPLVELDEKIDKAMERLTPKEEPEEEDSKTTPIKMFGGEAATKARVKSVKERFAHAKSDLYYPSDHKMFPDQPVMYGQDLSGQPLPEGVAAMAPVQLERNSEWDYAVCGAFFKWAANAQNLTGRPLPRQWKMTEQDKLILQEAMHTEKWTGIVGRGARDELDIESFNSPNVVNGRKLNEMQRKALIDDGTSGGTEAAPIVFDAAVITTPLLHGELFPLVSIVPITRGRRIEGFTISNPTFTSNVEDDTASTPFTTDSMVGAFDTYIYSAVGSIEIGLDFEQDSPVNMGALITQLYGEQAKTWLDNQIANGDGTTEPQGVFNATGITDIGNPAGGANAAPQPDDYITLWGNVNKEYMPASDKMRCVFIGNQTSYRRARAIAVGAADERRVFGMNIGNYELFEHPFKVQNDIANTLCGFFAMKFYRMYRRLGMTVRVETAGRTLALSNLSLIVVRMRWGGALTLGGAGSYSDNWQT